MKKWRNLILATLGVACLASMGACLSKQSPAVVHAEEATTEVVKTEETEEKESWYKNALETYIVPLFASMSITAIVSVILTVGLTVAKNHQLDKKILKITEWANEKNTLAEQKLAEATQILSVINDVYQMVLSNETLTKEMKDFVAERMNYAVSVAEKCATKVNKMDDVVKVLALLTQLETIIAQQSPNAVKSGIVEKINEISVIVKHL